MSSRRAFVLSSGAALLAAIAAPRAGSQQNRRATDSPLATITSLQQGLIAVAREGSDVSIDERYRALEPLILATHNLPYIAEFALRRQWASLGEVERQRFIAGFQRLSVMTYAVRFKAVGRDAFRAVTPGTAVTGGRVQVTTAVARMDQPDVSLEYLLQQDETGWRIVNIIADGVSDLALKRAEYQRVFASGGLEGLLVELEAQTEQLRKS
jgi:phospholipid transport system substrate-binding protein